MNLWLAVAFLTIFVLLLTLSSSAAQGQDNIFFEDLEDPENDANGPGTYELPLAGVYMENGQPIEGLFDIRKFTFHLTDENVSFQLMFKRLGKNVWDGPCGLSLEIVEIYVDCRPGGSTDAVYPRGPRVRMDEKHPWDFAVQATGWYTEGRNWLAFPDEEPLLDTIRVWADNENQTINISVSRGDLEPISPLPEGYPWYAVVLVGSQDGFGEGKWRSVAPKAETWAGGGADSEAYMAGVAPKVYDILLPGGPEQSEVLSGYDVGAGTYAMVPAICLMPELVKPEEGEGIEEEGLPRLPFVVAVSGFIAGLMIAMTVKPVRVRNRGMVKLGRGVKHETR